MKILFFCRLFYPHIGGVETHVEKLSLELIKKGHSVRVITEQFDSKLPRKQTYKGITIYRIPVTLEKRKKFEIWNWLWKHDFLIQDADIVHAHDVAFWFFPFKAIYPSKKFFTTFHGYETKFPLKKSAVLMRKMSRAISNGTINIGAYIEKWYGTKADVVMYGAIDPIQNSKVKIQNYNSKVKILFIGRIEEDNGVEVFAEALRILKRKKIPFEFKVLGDGSKRKIFEKYGKVLGFIKHVEKHITNTDIVFASSYLSIMQALNLKKKVVSVYTNPLKKDYLLRSPFAKYISVEQEPQSVTTHVREKPNIKKIQEGYNYVKHLTWKKVAEQYLLLWQK